MEQLTEEEGSVLQAIMEFVEQNNSSLLDFLQVHYELRWEEREKASKDIKKICDKINPIY